MFLFLELMNANIDFWYNISQGHQGHQYTSLKNLIYNNKKIKVDHPKI